MQNMNLLSKRVLWQERVMLTLKQYAGLLVLVFAGACLLYLLMHKSAAHEPVIQAADTLETAPDPFLQLATELHYLGYFQQGARISALLRLPNQKVIRVLPHALLNIQAASVKSITHQQVTLQNPSGQTVTLLLSTNRE